MYCLNSTATTFGGGVNADGDTKLICMKYLSTSDQIIAVGYCALFLNEYRFSSSDNLVTLNGASERSFVIKYDYSLNI